MSSPGRVVLPADSRRDDEEARREEYRADRVGLDAGAGALRLAGGVEFRFFPVGWIDVGNRCGSFATALPIAGSGNSSTLIATLFAPSLPQVYGWHTVFGFAMIPVTIVRLFPFLLAKNTPGQRAVKTWKYHAVLLMQQDTGWFCFLYSITFSSFVGPASYLSIFFKNQYFMNNIKAGDFTTTLVIFGSFLRPVGGRSAFPF